jgi:hypothetical protein
MPWRVLPDGRCVPMSRTEDLMSDAQALREDLERVIIEASEIAAESRDLVATVRKSRRLRTTTLRIVRSAEDL